MVVSEDTIFLLQLDPLSCVVGFEHFLDDGVIVEVRRKLFEHAVEVPCEQDISLLVLRYAGDCSIEAGGELLNEYMGAGSVLVACLMLFDKFGFLPM